MLYGDWALRFSEGLTRRVNSANPLREGARGLEEKLAHMRALYRQQGLPAIVRVPSFLDGALDRYLAQEGFTAEAETLALHGPLMAASLAGDPRISLATNPSEAWLSAKALLNGFGAQEAASYRKIISGIALPSVFVGLVEDGLYRSLAYGALHDGLLSLDSVVTAEEDRGKGYSRLTLNAVMAWAMARGAKEVCLQVQGDNEPAIGLYRSLGLRRAAYRYHYRREAAAD